MCFGGKVMKLIDKFDYYNANSIKSMFVMYPKLYELAHSGCYPANEYSQVLLADLKEAIDCRLTDPEKLVLRKIYIEGYTQTEVAYDLCTNQAHITRTVNSCCRKISDYLVGKH